MRERGRESIDTFRIVVHLLQIYISNQFHTIIHILCVEREREIVRTKKTLELRERFSKKIERDGECDE